jgi:hypothetical protein
MGLVWIEIMWAAIALIAGLGAGFLIQMALRRANVDVGAYVAAIGGAVLGIAAFYPLAMAWFGQPMMAARVETQTIPEMKHDEMIARVFADFPDAEANAAMRLKQAARDGGRRALRAERGAIKYEVGTSVAPHYMTKARDADLVRLFRMTADVGQAMLNNDPVRCVMWFTGQNMPDGSPSFDLRLPYLGYLAESWDEATRSLIINARDATPPPDEARLAEITATAEAAMQEKLSPEALALQRGERAYESQADFALACEATVKGLNEVLRLPEEDAAMLLRSRVGG